MTMVGQTIGKYQVQERVGRGGMGTVYRAVDGTLHRDVAIKVLNAELNDPEVARRFRAEAVIVARLNHPGIATIYELVQHDGQWLMVMEFVRGETIERMAGRLGTLPPARAADICIQVLEALAHAHRMGVVHRDLKPANLMLTETGALKVMDFGIARVAGSEHLTRAGFMLGTPAFMAPEQVQGREIDARTDLYAVGVVFHHLITAKLPFRGETPMALAESRLHEQPTPVREHRSNLPDWVDQVAARALARTPADRFQTAEAFRDALQRGLAGLPIDYLPSDDLPPELVATLAPGAARVPTATGSERPVAAVPFHLRRVAGLPMVPAAAAAGLALVVVTSFWLLSGSRSTALNPTTAQAAPVVPAEPPVSPPASVPEPLATPPESPPADAPTVAATSKPRVPRDALVTFGDLSYLTITGQSAAGEDAALYIGGGQISVMSRPSGATLATMRYPDVRASYARARTPRWDPALPGPTANLDLPGGFPGLRGASHWLVLQSPTTHAVLSLPDAEWSRVLDVIAQRTGRPVARPERQP